MDGQNGRDPRGRFVRGNPGGPGRPRNPKVLRLQAAFRAAITPKRLRELALTLWNQAMRGDTQAARLLLDRTCGKPVTTDRLPELTEFWEALQETLPLLERAQREQTANQ